MLSWMLTVPTCVFAIPSRIRSSVHVPHVRKRVGLSAVTLCFLLNSRRLMYLLLAGRILCTIAPSQTFCLPLREFLLATENLLRSSLTL